MYGMVKTSNYIHLFPFVDQEAPSGLDHNALLHQATVELAFEFLQTLDKPANLA